MPNPQRHMSFLFMYMAVPLLPKRFHGIICEIHSCMCRFRCCTWHFFSCMKGFYSYQGTSTASHAVSFHVSARSGLAEAFPRHHMRVPFMYVPLFLSHGSLRNLFFVLIALCVHHLND